MANMLFANNANTTLASSLTNVATTMSVTSASAFPSPTGSQYFYCTLADAATQTTIEIVKVTAVSGTTFTIVRGQDGTSGTAFASGDVVSLRLVRASLNDFPKLDENNTFSYAPTFNTALGVASGGTGVTSATGTGAGAAVVLNQAPAINSPVITAYSTSTVPLKVCGLSGQFTELFDVYTYNGGTLAFQINSSGAIATGTWNGSVIGAAYGGTGEAGTLTGILYGNGTSAHTVATTAQLLSGIGTLPVANGGTGLTSLTAGYIPYGNGTSALSTSSSLFFNGYSLGIGTTSPVSGSFGSGVTVNVPTGQGARLDMQVNSASYLAFTADANWITFDANSPYRYYYNGTQVMTLFASGGLSLGNTTDPGAGNLSVNSQIFVGTTTAYATLGASVQVANASGRGQYAAGPGNTAQTYSFGRDNVTTGNFVFAYNGSVISSISPSTGVYTPLSDSRVKKNINPLSYGLKETLLLNPVIYNMITEEDTDKKHMGLIAQEVKAIIDEAVADLKDDENEMYGLATSELVPVLINAIKELNTKFDAYAASHP